MEVIKKIAKRIVTKHYFYTYKGRGVIDDKRQDMYGDGFVSAYLWESPADIRLLVKADLLEKRPELNPTLERFERVK